MAGEDRTVEVERVLTQEDFDRFARLSGDDNPIHVDPAFAAGTRFGGTVAHGVLLVSILRGLLERLVPGTRQVSQQLMFPAPTYTGEPMCFHAAIDADDGTTVSARIRCTRIGDGTVTCDGITVLRRQEA